MAQLINVLAAETHDLKWIQGSHIVEEQKLS